MPVKPSTTPSTARNLAVFIDADNLCDPTALDHVLTDVRQRAERVLYKRAYGRAESLKTIESVLWRHGVRPVANMIVNKVTTDSALVIDAVEAICTNSIDAVAICSGDADFVPLATWLREKGCQVWCFSLADRIFANPESFYDDVVLMELVAAQSTCSPPALLPQPPASAISAKELFRANDAAPDTVQEVLKAFPALRSGLPQHLNEVVAVLRQQGILGKSQKTAAWFRQNAETFRLLPSTAPNRIIYSPSAVQATSAPAVSTAKLPVPSTSRLPDDPAAGLRQNKRLMTLLYQAVQASQDAHGWAAVSAIRMHLGGKSIFDVRAQGFATLTKMLVATQAFELRAAGTPQVAVCAKSTVSSKACATVPAAPDVVSWPSQHGRRPAPPLPTSLHALRAALLKLAVQRLRREDVLQAVPELIFGAPCALHAVAGRMRAKGLLARSQSALRIFECYPQSFEIDLSHHPQIVRYVGTIIS